MQSLVLLVCSLATLGPAPDPEASNFRVPRDESDLRAWLENMVWHHGFSNDEITRATGLADDRIRAALKKFDIRPETRPKRPAGASLLVLPYPGGRHPRIGFRDGAIRPQRETKVSVFTPWDEGYVVVDVPEAIWSDLGLTYLAHTHVPTLWTKKKIDLEPLEWLRKDDRLELTRKLPNGIAYRALVTPRKDTVDMDLWLTNGSDARRSDLRVQVCVLLAGAKGFAAQDNANKVTKGPYVACKSADGKRWVITAWQPLHRAWANEKCPCLHSDPRFPDCAPGETQHVFGRLWFYEGTDIDAELQRVEMTGWRKKT